MKHNFIRLIYSLLIIITLLFSTLNFGIRENGYVTIIFFGIGLLSLSAAFFSSNKRYSLNKVFWIFNYIFFFLAPVYQFKNNIVFHFKGFIEDETYIVGGILILIALILYFFSYNLFFNKIKNNESFELEKYYKFTPLIIASFFSSLIFLYLIKFDLSVLVYRQLGVDFKPKVLYGNLGYAVISIIRYVPFFSLLLYILSDKIKKQQFLILLFLTLFLTFPTSLSRGIVAGMYLPLLLFLFPVFKNKINFILLFLVSVLLFFPLANSFRNIKNQGFSFNYELFSSQQFDAFQNFILLVKENIITNGSQLVDSFLFFNGKGVCSGQILGERIGYNFYNVAMPYIGEGFINFGYFGIVFFIIFLALFNAFLDKKQHYLNLSFKSIYLVLIGFQFYILRGDLSSSIKKMTGFIFALLIVVFTSYIFKKLNKKA
ncbi:MULTISPECIES: hypothetical protein [Tenacibaculum]|uniref:hypothetical protein n=1 Tax=Tenacibaculum TaxID=104267 RepID=UPI001F0B3EDE|nr:MULTISPECIES: hypothetical protein [Tenacibaculum]MCH3883146.1 hypothetical protein [Tenacibaculum aquimarinum]MDO6600884.1 hypothetical protein [Tenacibaculum sp. 1_MG-2023]